MSNSLEKLKKYQEEGFLFHGSSDKLECLEPRQAYTFINKEKVKDGEPAVFTSPFYKIAIFMSLFNKKNCQHGFDVGYHFDNGNFNFRATKKSMDQLNDSSVGYVYVFSKDDFSERNSAEFVSYKTVKPVGIIEVGKSDLDIKDILIF